MSKDPVRNEMSYDKANSQKHFPVQVIAETFDLAREKLQRL